MIVCRIVVVCINVWWILHFTLHNRGLRDALLVDVILVDTSYMRILRYDTHGQIMTMSGSEKRNALHLAV